MKTSNLIILLTTILHCLFIYSAMALPATTPATTPTPTPSYTQLSCTLLAGKGPFASFKIYQWPPSLDEDHEDLMELGYVLTSELAGLSHEKIQSVGSIMEYKEGNLLDDRKYLFHLGEWAVGTIYSAPDDEGIAAFVSLQGDGPSLTGYYRCEASGDRAQPNSR
jgi:hypothetical protein